MTAANRPILLPIMAWWFTLLYLPTIADEERALNELFGDDYQGYCEQVPRLIPRRLFAKSRRGGFVWDLVWANREHMNLFGIVLALLGIGGRLFDRRARETR